MKRELIFKGPWWQPTGGRPVMTAAEWEIVKFGILKNLDRIRPYFDKRSAEKKQRWDAEDRGLPKEERQRRWQERFTAEQNLPTAPLKYGRALWLTHFPDEDVLVCPPPFGTRRAR
jgi:hypothetical protein